MNLLELLNDPNTRWVLAGCMLLGLSSGVLGSFAFLRGRSLVGDALAHAALPGVCLAFLFTGTKSVGLFLIGAALAGLVASWCMSAIPRFTRIKEDSALAITLSVFFGIGIVLLTYIQHTDSGNQSGLDKFLFGQAASLVAEDVNTMIAVSVVLLTVVTLLFKELKLLAFDPGFGRGLGFPMGVIEAILMLMLLAAVVIGLQAVGVVLMAAMLITPAVTARYWTDRLGVMVVLAGAFGALSGALGTLISTQVENLPTGPVIVLAATACFLVSLIASPRRGLIAKLVRFARLRRRVLMEDVMTAIYERLEQQAQYRADALTGGCTLTDIADKSGKPLRAVRRAVTLLKRQGWVQVIEPNGEPGVVLTASGMEAAWSIVYNQRLWDVYLMHEQEFQMLRIDPHRDDIAAQLSPDALAELNNRLHDYGLVPTLTASPVQSGQVLRTKEGGLST